MENKKTTPSPEESIGSSVRQYVNMQIDRFALKGAEKMSWFTNKVIVTLIFIVSAMVLFLLLCFALSYFFGELLGSTALGFLCTAGIVLIVILIVFLLRKKLFANQMARMYTKLLLGDEGVKNMDELKVKEQIIEARIESKEEVIVAEYHAFKGMINPKNWINSIKEHFTGKRAAKEEEQEHTAHTAHTEAKTAAHSTKKSESSSHKKGENYQENQW
ncbi:MAG: hypothetical protein J6Z32_06350 [Bacteroidales bacterium]|nr:hypothetical protein [Bacteroidales bacterium]